jgi:hypothetical protein
MQFRPIDLALVVALAVAIVLPRETPEVLPLLAFDTATRLEVGLAEQRLVRALAPVGRAPAAASADEAVGLTVGLAERYVDAGHPELAVSALLEVARSGPAMAADWCVALAAAGALSELLSLEPALSAVEQALEGCRLDASCSAATRTKAMVFRRTLASVVEQGIDPRREPARLRAALGLAIPRARMRSPRPLNRLP